MTVHWAGDPGVEGYSMDGGAFLCEPLGEPWPDLTVEEAHEQYEHTGRAYRTSRGTYHPESGLIDVRWPLASYETSIEFPLPADPLPLMAILTGIPLVDLSIEYDEHIVRGDD